MSELSETVADSLRAAYYYAAADGRPVVDPALVLMAAARNDKATAKPVLGTAVADSRAGLGSSQPAAPASGPWSAELREIRWWILRENPEFGAGGHTPVWSEAVGVALDRAAGRSGGPVLRMVDLLGALLDSADPSVPALATLTGADFAEARARLEHGEFGDDPVQAGPFPGIAGLTGALTEANPVGRWLSGSVARMLTRHSKVGGPMFVALEREAVRQAARLGHPAVQSSTLLLAVLSADEQLAAARTSVREAYRAVNTGAGLLRERGITLAEAQRVAESIHAEPELLPREQFEGRLAWDYPDADPGWTADALRVWETTRGGDPATRGTSQLTEALLSAPPPAARALLTALGKR